MTGGVRRPLFLLGAGLSAGAGVIHFALGPEHVAELGSLGFGFFLSGAFQLGWAVALGALLLVPSAARAQMAAFRALAASGIAINIAILGAWLVSRVAGLPAGEMPWTPEPVGRPDAVAGILEVVLVVGIIGAARDRTIGRQTSSRWLAASAAVALSAVVIGTAFAITPEIAHEDGHDHAAGGMVMTVEADGRR